MKRPGMDNQFRGFTSESFNFFRELAQNNNKAWFDQNRPRYEEHVVGNFRGLLRALEPSLLKLNSHFETTGKTNGNLSRINRDIRFSKDKSPYKSNFYLYVFDGRHDRDHAGRLYVGLNADCVTVGFSIYAAPKSGPKGALETLFRRRLLTHRDLFEGLIREVVRGGRYETYWHREEKREWALHPGLPRKDADWQTLQAWIIRKVFPPNAKGIANPDFTRKVEEIFRGLSPIYVFTSVASPKWQAELTNPLR